MITKILTVTAGSLAIGKVSKRITGAQAASEVTFENPRMPRVKLACNCSSKEITRLGSAHSYTSKPKQESSSLVSVRTLRLDQNSRPCQEESKPQAPSESESLCSAALGCSFRGLLINEDAEEGRRLGCGGGVPNWPPVRDDTKSVALLLRRFLIGPCFGGGI